MHFNGNDVFTGINEARRNGDKNRQLIIIRSGLGKSIKLCVIRQTLTTSNGNPVNVNQGSVIIDNPEEITFT